MKAMKLTDRIKSKLASINLVSVAFFALSIFSIAFAWFAYTNSVSTNFQANVKTWKINFKKTDSTPITNEITISVDDLYPGMNDFTEGFVIQNLGEIPALLEYNITYCRIFDEVINTNNLTEHELNNKFPFQIGIIDSGARRDMSYLSTTGGNATQTLSVGISWNLYQGDDDLDTEYGNLAYQFKQSEEALHQANSNYVVRHSLEMKLEIKATQYVDETNSFATDSWKTIKTAVIMNNTSKYHVGDTKNVTIDGTNYTVRLANKSSSAQCSGGNDFSDTACGFVVEFVDIIEEKSMYNLQTLLSPITWNETEIYKYLQGDFFSSLPYDLKKYITNTRTITKKIDNQSYYDSPTDRIYLPNEIEIYGESIGYDSTISRQLDYYRNVGVNTNNYSYARKKYHGTYSDWYLRSPNSLTTVSFTGGGSRISESFAYIEDNGDYDYGFGYNIMGISPAFRLK